MADDDQPDLSTFTESDGDADTQRDGAEASSSDDVDDADATGEGEPVPEAGEPVGQLDQQERVELGVDLLAHIETESLSLSDAVDRIESVTTNPALTREILDTAELRGIIEREGGRLRTRRGGTYVRFEQQVVKREGDYECRRCGASLSTGHFVKFEAGELGPFGPSCVRKILGRE